MSKIYDEILYSESLSDFASLIEEVGAERVALDFVRAFPDLASELNRFLVFPKDVKKQPIPMPSFEIEVDDCRYSSAPYVSGKSRIMIESWEVRLPKPSSRHWRRVYFCPLNFGTSINAESSSFYFVKTNDDIWTKVKLPAEFTSRNP